MVEKIETDELSSAEHSEFITYVERLEREDAERARALVKLAQVRNVAPRSVINEFLPKIAALGFVCMFWK